MLSKISFIAVIILIIALSGCIDEKSITQRLACMDLSTPAETTIPNCNSAESCYSAVERAFPLKYGELPAATQQALSRYKNQVARSWLYYNHANQNLSQIYTICYTGKNIPNLMQLANELNHNIVESFSSLDAANQTSFEILVLENSALISEDINTISEEQLFNVHALISTNLAELQTPSKPAITDSYVSHYFSLVDRFSDLSSRFGSVEVIEREVSPYDILAEYDNQLLSAVKGTAFYIPIMKDAVTAIIDTLLKGFDYSKAVQLLQLTPSFDFFSLFDSFAGTESSLVSHFLSIIDSDNSARNQLKESNLQIRSKIDQKINETQQTISSLDSSVYSPFDSSFFSTLTQLLGRETLITSKPYFLEEVSTFKENAQKRLFSLTQNNSAIKDSASLGHLSLGGETSLLKETYSEISLLNQEVEFFAEEFISTLENLCNERADMISKRLKEIEEQAIQQSILSDTFAVTESKLKAFKSGKSLQLCSEMLSDYNKLEFALENFHAYEYSLLSAIDDCISNLDEIFSIANLLVSVSSFRTRYSQLKSLSKPYENPLHASESCSRLNEDLTKVLLSEPELNEIIDSYTRLAVMLQKLSQIDQLSPSSITRNRFLDLVKKSDAITERYFPEQTPKLAAILPKIQEIKFSLLKLEEEAENLLEQGVSDYISKTAKIELIGSSDVFIDKESLNTIKITITNPFWKVPYPTTIILSLSMAADNITISYKPSCLSSVYLNKGNLALELNSIPLGTVSTILDLNAILATAEREIKILSFSSQEATLVNTLSISAKANIPKLSCSAELFPTDSISNVFVSFNNKQVQFYTKENQIFFDLHSVESKSEAKIFYSIKNPLEQNLQLVSQTEIDGNTTRYEYSLTLKNTLVLPLQSKKITLALPVQKTDLLDAKLIDNSGKVQELSILSTNLASFNCQDLPPNQPVRYTLVFTIKDVSNYWSTILSELLNRTNQLTFSENSDISKKAKSLFAELSSLESSGNFSDRSFAEKIAILSEEFSLLESQSSSLLNQGAHFRQLRDALESELFELQNSISSLQQSGLYDEALSLKQSVEKGMQMLADAESAALSSDYNAAITILLMAIDEISEARPSSAIESLTAEANVLFSYSRELSELFSKYRLENPGTESARQELDSLELELAKHFSNEDFPSAKNTVNVISEKVSDYNKLAQDLLKQSSELIKIQIDNLRNSLRETILGKISRLEKILAAVDEKTLADSQYVLPITAERLSEISDKIDELKLLLNESSIKSFTAYLSNKNYPAALDKSDEFSKSLADANAAAQFFEEELDIALLRFSSDAEVFYNSALDKLRQSDPANNEVALLLKEAKESYDKQDYLKSITLSDSARRLLSFKKPISALASFPLPYSIFPLAAIAAGVLYYRFRKGKNQNTGHYKKILRNH